MTTHTTATSRTARTLIPSLLTALFIYLSCGVQTAQAAALSTLIHSGSRSCYYAWVDQVGEKVGWYFAVQSGGNFEIDWSVTSPSNKIIVDGSKERQADIIFTGQEIGEYTFCFEEPAFAGDKLVDFDITVESEPRLSMPLNPSALLSDHSAPLESSISKVQEQLTDITRTQRYFRTWENRGFDLVRSTKSKLFYFSVIESLLIIGISFGQVSLIRYLFDSRGTKRYRV